jgi:hypothetical protein
LPLRLELERRLRTAEASRAPAPARRFDRYVLACQLCGEDAAFVCDEADVVVERVLPVVGSQPIRLTAADTARAALREPDPARRLHALLVPIVASGLHRYCPPCGRVYCERHYPIQSEWDGSWYQGARATCPLGHAREID